MSYCVSWQVYHEGEPLDRRLAFNCFAAPLWLITPNRAEQRTRHLRVVIRPWNHDLLMNMYHKITSDSQVINSLYIPFICINSAGSSRKMQNTICELLCLLYKSPICGLFYILLVRTVIIYALNISDKYATIYSSGHLLDTLPDGDHRWWWDDGKQMCVVEEYVRQFAFGIYLRNQ